MMHRRANNSWIVGMVLLAVAAAPSTLWSQRIRLPNPLPAIPPIVTPPTSQAPQGPFLRRHGDATQLIVNGKPFLILGGELHNSSASSLEYMEPIWDRLVSLNLNTALAVVSWELIEPEEGRFDFHLVDGLIAKAREHNLKLVFLWFGSWKNGVSTYVPAWVKTDTRRFPRMRRRNGASTEVLSTLSLENLRADARAFATLMRHIRDVDQKEQTVLMMQVENEAGLLGDSRDRSPEAEAAFDRPVPADLLRHFIVNRDRLIPEFRTHWENAGRRTRGTWSEVFGDGADEAFMAWHMARYIGAVAAAGKREYDIPMYANAWLVQNDTQKPGQYPSGGPVSKVMDIWRIAAPAIDFIAPDIYLPDFKAICASYTRQGNPLFIPEAGRGPDAAAKAFYAVGQCSALGFAPFGIDSLPPDHPIRDSYSILHQLAPIITKYRGTGQMMAILPDRPDGPNQRAILGDYNLEIGLDRNSNIPAYGLAIYLGNDEFIVAGAGLGIHFSARTPGPANTGILSVDEGRFINGRWLPGRRLNGDENAGGWRLQLPPGPPTIQRIKLYRYE